MGEGAGMLEKRILALKTTCSRGKNYLKGTEGRHLTKEVVYIWQANSIALLKLSLTNRDPIWHVALAGTCFHKCHLPPNLSDSSHAKRHSLGLISNRPFIFKAVLGLQKSFKDRTSEFLYTHYPGSPVITLSQLAIQY